METYIVVANYTQPGMANIKDAPVYIDEEIQINLPGSSKPSRHGRVPGNFKREAYPMSTEQNKALDLRYVEEVLNKGNLAAIDEIMAPDYVGHVPGFPDSDRDGDKQLIAMFRAAFPDLHFTIENQIAEGNKVVHQLTARGSHRGEFNGIPPTGKQVVVTGININRITEGKVVESWGIIDMLSLMQQLGVVPTPEQG